MKETLIIVMAKQPQVGKTKTRLLPALSLGEAADLYQALLLDTLSLVADQTWAELAVAITPPGSRPYFESITPPGTLLLPVDGGDIGECLVQALEMALGMGYRKALALNSDGPSLPAQYLERAALYLEEAELVLGPAEDGGYYLVGMSRLHAAIFKGIDWSTAQVFSQTLDRAAGLGQRVALTPAWYDVDTPADLYRLQKELESLPADRLPHTRRLLAALDLRTRSD
jgi:uncharacterized protein